MCFFPHVPRITLPKNYVPRSKALLYRPRVDRQTHTDTQTDTKVTTVGTLSGFQGIFLLPIIKDRPNKKMTCLLACFSLPYYVCALMLFFFVHFCTFACSPV